MKEFIIPILFFISLVSCNTTPNPKTKETKTYKIAFGSCNDQNRKPEIFNTVISRQPDLFIFMGDNIYADTRDIDELKKEYAKLGAYKAFQKLKDSTTVLATWDDHDYGENDVGRHYPIKEASKELFLEFWNEPQDSERRKHKGIYHSVMLDDAPIKIQVILLDTRTFRDDLTPNSDPNKYKNKWQPTFSEDSTFLGNEQWIWLEKQLSKEADLRIIGSSNQFSHEYNGWESWNNFPYEKKKMLKLIQRKRANGIVFISGDIHWGELCRYDNKFTYPLYDVTSSSLTKDWRKSGGNSNRIGTTVLENNFGLIEVEIDKDVFINFKIVNKDNITRLRRRVKLSNLGFKEDDPKLKFSIED